ncbi:flagellar export protein FliJ [Allobacillus sp. SKP2-8]|nr:flagellar export protein FliJ [Allobacillus sp. SKP2-8]
MLMNTIHSIERIYNIREKEMNEAQAQYQRAIDYFEEQATELFQLLKKKETLQERFDNRLKGRVTITYIHAAHDSIQRIEKEEKALQTKVHQARVNMKQKENQLKVAHLEMKKMEKLIQLKKEELKEFAKKKEAEFMDEISMQQYFRTR